MSPAQLWAAAALAAALADLLVPLGAEPRAWRRLLRAAPAGVLALAARAFDAPVLLALTLAALAAADALDADREPGFAPGQLSVAVVALLLLAALLFEMGRVAQLAAEPWRALPAAALGVTGAALLALRPKARSGPVGVLAPLLPATLALAALGAGVAPPYLWLTDATVALLAAALALELARRAAGGGPIAPDERALRSGAAGALAYAFLGPLLSV